MHHLVESSPLVWCSACGAYGVAAPRLLTQPCRGDPRGKPELKGMAAQLRALQKGRHPETKAKLGAPATMTKLNGTDTAVETVNSPRSSVTCLAADQDLPTIDRDGTEFSEAFRRRGKKRAGEQPAGTIRERVRARQAEQLIQASRNKRKIQELLTQNELNDPDLVEFWSEPIGAADLAVPVEGVESDDREPAGNQQRLEALQVLIEQCGTRTAGASSTLKPSRLERDSTPSARSKVR